MTPRENSGFAYRERVRPEHAGRSVLTHHVERWPHSSEAAWRERIDAGLVTIAGEVATPERVLRAGEEIVVRRPAWVEPDAPLTFEVLYEDDDALVVVKPAGLQVLPAGPFLDRTLLALVRASDASRSDASPIHRLGRGTSGVILFGRTARARASLSRELREGRVGKLYLAIARGRLETSFVATQPIGPVEGARGIVHAASPGGRPSRTRVRVLRRDLDDGAMLVAAWPITGRTDQIRIHLAASGAPIVGDPLFAAGGALLDARPGDVGYFLHSTTLRFRHPATQRVVVARSLPEWL